MRILGLDLAAQPRTTGCVVLAPDGPGRWAATKPEGPADDDRLVALAREVDVLGIDAPLGWPRAFVAAVVAHEDFGPWPGGVDRGPLTHRVTDHVVVARGEGRPLSVSADRIGSPAMRGALLQHRWATEVWGAPESRDGTGRLVETYPAASLRAWGVEATGYKRGGAAHAEEARRVRAGIVAHLAATLPWVDVDPVADPATASDHVLDALLCCLTVVAARAGTTTAPAGPDEVAAARVEGWVHVPTAPLAALTPPP
ncbi:DUF429 domain-containing protein [Iamia majanohamensis]|uniref:DUF429 domain-containing protein n=1 Tax=Iamia majanohamensis TaxID=467976 RepID=A0AAE9YFM2_9ACTN|nr:DUF429 domain-containing protein [Iamia majanohamensis]WCO66926.1 DUF429 domain-containing protein [Iamia majanohamensis]